MLSAKRFHAINQLTLFIEISTRSRKNNESIGPCEHWWASKLTF